jgi:hypothetical protein
MLKKLWMDEGGATISAELALIGTILVVGVVVGLSAVLVTWISRTALVASLVTTLRARSKAIRTARIRAMCRLARAA